MDTITSTELTNRTSEILNKVFYRREPLTVCRRRKQLVVIVDIETWNEMTVGRQNDEIPPPTHPAT